MCDRVCDEAEEERWSGINKRENSVGLEDIRTRGNPVFDQLAATSAREDGLSTR